MASNKDIRELMEARKQRRGVPQLDPADVVSEPEPEFMAPKDTGASSQQPSVPATKIEPVVHVTPEKHHPQDNRYLPIPLNDTFIAKTYKFKAQRYKQLIDEKHFTGIEIQDVLDDALGDYFEKKYGTPKEPS